MADRSRRPLAVTLAVSLLVALGAATPAAAAPAEAGVPLTTGDNSLGQQGDGGTAGRTSPGPVALSDVVAIASGRDDGYALDSQHQVWAWGTNGMGEIGDGTTTTRRTPVKVLTDVEQIEAGHDHGIALKRDGTVWTWGYGGLGQLGLGTTNNRTVPAQVPGLTGVVAVAAGRDMSFALLGDGTLRGWGNNSYGEVGDGTTTRRTTPVPVLGISGVVEIVGGRNHALARTQDGSVFAWGDNTYGQVGDGTTTGRRLPVKVLTGAVWLAAGAHHSVAALADGRVMTWGRGYRGALGSGGTSNRLAPAAVAGLPPIVRVGDGRDTSFALTADGSVWDWGDNGLGQLGDGTTTRRLSPVLVPGLSGITNVQGGASHTVFMPAAAGGPVNQRPVAAVTASCTELSCTFDGSGSDDPDGTVTSWRWSFGDSSPTRTTDVPTTTYAYATGGSYQVRLTVVDDDGALSDPATVTVQVSGPPPTGAVSFRAVASARGNSTSARADVPSTVRAGDQLLLLVSTNTQTAVTSAPAGWSLRATQLDGTDLRTLVYARTAGAADAGAAATTTLAAQAKWDVTLLAYAGVDPAAPPVAACRSEAATSTTQHASAALTIGSSGTWVVSSWVDKSVGNTGWTLPADQTGRSTSIGSGTGRLTSVTSDTAGPVAVGAWPGRTAVAVEASGKAIGCSIALVPAP